MADIVVRIKTNEGYDEVETFSSSREVNNVSTPTTQTTTQNDGVNGKTRAFGFLSLSDGYLGGKDTKLTSEVDKYNGYMFGVTDENGEYVVDIEISGSAFDKINIIGDKNANQFPTVAILDMGTENEKTLYSDDINWGIGFNTTADTHTIRFTDWNRAGYNACFTTLTVFVENIELNRAYIQELTFNSESNFDTTSINYGVVSNSGDLKLLDIEGELADYIKDGIIDNSNMPVEVVLNGKTVQHHITNDSSYNDRERVLSLSLTNKASLLDDMIFNGMPYQNSSMKAYDVLRYIMLGIYTEDEFENAMNKECAVYYDDEDRISNIGVYLRNINIPHPYLQQSTYREAIDKVCDISMLNFYIDNDNNPSFCSARPIAYEDEIDNAIVIPSYMQVSELDKDVILKNKYDAVSIMKTSPIIEIEEDSAIGSIETSVTPVYETGGASFNTGTSAVGVIVSFARIEPYYITGSFVTNKNTPDNLRQLEEMTGSDYTLTMRVEKGTTELSVSEAQSSTGPIKNKNTTYPDSYIKITETGGLSGKIPTLKATSSVSGVGYFEATITDKTNISLTNNNDGTVSVSYKILAGVRTFNSVATSISNATVASGEYVSYMAESVSISVLGNVININMNNEEDYSTDNISTGKTIAMLNNNEIQQDIKLIEGLKRNVLADYKNGVTSASITTFCGDFYNKDGQKVINFKDGDIILPNSIVFFENDFDNKGSQRYWRVSGSSFESTSVENELSLVEIANVIPRKYRKITFSNVVRVYNGDTRINSGDEFLDGTKLRIVFGGDDLIDLRATAYGSIPDGYTISLYEDTNITVRYYNRTVVEKSFTFPTSTSGTVNVVFDDNYDNIDTDLDIYMTFDSSGNGTMWTVSKDTINNFANTSMSDNYYFQGDIMFVGTIITNIGVSRTLRISNMNSSYLGKRGSIYCEKTYISFASGL